MTVRSLEERVQRMEDVHEIQNLMSKIVYYHCAGMQNKTIEMYASKTPGVRMEMADWGIWEGIDGIKKHIAYHDLGVGDRTGKLSLLPISTPVIEVAGDGKTAKGLWIAAGAESGRFGPNKELQAYWAWAKYGADFVKEDGKWKLWRNQVYSLFFTPYEKTWIREYEHPTFNVPDEYAPDKPPSYNWHYSPSVKTELVPVPPEPYETWDGKSMTTGEL